MAGKRTKGGNRGKRPLGSNPLLKLDVEERARELAAREAELMRPLMMGEKGLNARQELFVHEYLKDMDAAAAYMRAGYDCQDKKSAAVGASLLMKNVLVLSEIDKVQCERMQRLDVDGDWTLLRFRRIYTEAVSVEDWGNACRALENIGKHLGIYERDNRQKVYTASDAEKLREELEQAGFSMERTNYTPPPPSPN